MFYSPSYWVPEQRSDKFVEFGNHFNDFNSTWQTERSAKNATGDLSQLYTHNPVFPNKKEPIDIEGEILSQNLYKTELCRTYEDTKTCRYGSKCQFAHGKEELRPVLRHPKYKTEVCKTYYTTGSCPYGKRCRFIHTTVILDKNSKKSAKKDSFSKSKVQKPQVVETSPVPPLSFSPPSVPSSLLAHLNSVPEMPYVYSSQTHEGSAPITPTEPDDITQDLSFAEKEGVVEEEEEEEEGEENDTARRLSFFQSLA